MKNLFDEIPAAIAQMEEVFDSHKLILKLAQANQKAYVQALSKFEGDKPFGKLHAQLSLAIGETKLVEKIDQHHTSENIWREVNECALWRKIGSTARG